MSVRNALSIVVTIVLCLPSLVGGSLVAGNALLNRQLEAWSATSQASVALGVFFGVPFVAVAALIGLLSALGDRLSTREKALELITVFCAAIATIALLARFSTRSAL